MFFLFGLFVGLSSFACGFDVLLFSLLVDRADHYFYSFSLGLRGCAYLVFLFFLLVVLLFYASVGLCDCLLHVRLFLFLSVCFGAVSLFPVVSCPLTFFFLTVVLCLFASLLDVAVWCCVLWETVLMFLYF